MGDVYFYHLTRRPLEATLPPLLTRCLSQGWRVVVRGADAGRLEWLDEKLWLDGDDGFLPHGLAGGPHDQLQPILLTVQADATAQCVMSIDGAQLDAQTVGSAERCCVLFDGNDEQAVRTARSQWKELTDAGCAAQYWSEESGHWEKKAEAKG